MKLSNRAKSALATAGYPVNENSAIAQLVAFAAQNSGIEPRNYYDPYDLKVGRRNEYYQGLRALKSEQRSISEDWRRFKQALTVAAIEGVTDADVIAEAPHAYSGRLEWKPETGTKDGWECKRCGVRHYAPDSSKVEACAICKAPLTPFIVGEWSYCTGQYFCTEYRKAAATLLESATCKARQARPATKQMPGSIAELKVLNAKNGGCWFEPSSMRFFGTRIESGIIAKHYFITSEQQDEGRPRNYSVRSFNDVGDVDTIGEFHEHSTKADAMEALREHLKQHEAAIA